MIEYLDIMENKFKLIDFVFQGVSLIFKGNSAQIFNFLLCMCLGGAY